MIQADGTLSRAFPRYILCPYCPPNRQSIPVPVAVDLWAEFLVLLQKS